MPIDMRINGSALFLALLISVIPASAAAQAVNSDAQSAEVVFDLGSGDSVQQVIKFIFAEPLAAGPLNYTTGSAVRGVSITDDSGTALDYDIIQQDNGTILRIFAVGSTKTLTLGYIIDSAIFHSNSISHFFTEFSFDTTLDSLSMQVKLPPGYGIYQNDYQPRNASIASDGQRIIISWNEANVSGPLLFSVKFSNLGSGPVPLPVFVIIFAATVAALYFYFRRKTKEAFMKGFREDERKTISYLQSHNTVLQKDLQAEFGFSRAKATRIVFRLESDGLLTKQKYGRTNKLFWKK